LTPFPSPTLFRSAHGEPQRAATEATLRSFGYRAATHPSALVGRFHAVFGPGPATPRGAADPPAGVVAEPDAEP
jgi:hypothetical protein